MMQQVIMKTELIYTPTLLQRLSRIILGTLLVPLFGDICVLLYALGWDLVKEDLMKLLGFLAFTYLIALFVTGIPTLIFRVIIEWSTQNLMIRLLSSFVFAVILGIFINITDFGTLLNANRLWLWILFSIIAVIITELLLYQHIKRCIKKHNQHFQAA